MPPPSPSAQHASASDAAPPDRPTVLGRRLARLHSVETGPGPGRPLHRRLDRAGAFLAAAYTSVRGTGPAPAPGVDTAMPGAEWLLDNYYIIRDQVAEIRVDLPRRYYGELPKLVAGPGRGYPRAYALARVLV